MSDDPIRAQETLPSPDDVVGHKTFATGELCPETGLPQMRHEPLTRAEADALWADVEKCRKAREERMPDEKAAIDALHEAWTRLKELGWSEPQYCPKDGTKFKVIELGSTGLFDCYYQGNWPDGLYMVSDDLDVYPTSTSVAMYRLYPEDQAKKDAKMAELRRKFREARDAES